METIREQLEELEKVTLSKYAALSCNSQGRDREEEPDDIRPCYERDRDRILHCKAFRRLKHKTQVFISPEGDHYRTRLTHTLEVSQIARTIGKALRLNNDLIEAIALGHDLGHTPFGHVGERALSKYTTKPFCHNEQSIRVVERLEKNGKGLNLTWEVRDGILNHRSRCVPATLEGKIVRLSDKIAYVNHDIDDGIRAGILTEDMLPDACTNLLGHNTRDRINTLIHTVVTASTGIDDIILPQKYQEAFQELRKFMFRDLYTNPVAKSEEVKAERLIGMLYEEFMEHEERLPEEYRMFIEQGELKETVICDYIAGMSDNYSVKIFNQLFVPMFWLE